MNHILAADAPVVMVIPGAGRQGAHRLARGSHFYRTARATADSLQLDFAWRRVVVPGVGHDFERMSEAAAAYLYGRTVFGGDG